MTTANELKIRLVGAFLKNRAPDEAISTELSFREGASRADLAISSRTRLCAVEVKGPRDDFRRISAQLEAYSRYFLEVYVAVEGCALDTARRHVDRRFGLIAVDASGVRQVRRAKVRTRLAKAESSAWLSNEKLTEIARQHLALPRNVPRELLIEIVCAKVGVDELSSRALTHIYQKVLPRFELFQTEQGKVLTSDDLQTLLAPYKIS